MKFFPGHTPLFRGAWGPILQLDPPIFFCSYVSPYHKGPESAITPKIYSSTDNPLNKAAMKKARTRLNFENDTAFMLGREISLACTRSGHYYVPLSSWVFLGDTDVGYVLFVNEISDKSSEEKLKIATKLHRQFSHPSGNKL